MQRREDGEHEIHTDGGIGVGLAVVIDHDLSDVLAERCEDRSLVVCVYFILVYSSLSYWADILDILFSLACLRPECVCVSLQRENDVNM
jgi:hypothetical protein